MAEVASAFVSLVPSAKGFGAGIEREIGGDLDGAGKKSGSRFGRVFASTSIAPMRAIGAAAVGLFAGAQIAGFFKDAISEARESQKVGALTAQVIKSTGGAAKVTAGQVGDLAAAISNKTGIDDEAIQSASNLLLTFTNVRNEVGKGNDIFNQATQAATDMGAALGGDPKTSAIQLGKALNDPIKGITALSRVGVSFTAGQKKQVEAMVKSGNTLGAQKLILGELNKEFGGAAAASATAGEKMSVAFGNFKESVGTALLPVIDKVANFLTTKIIPAMTAAIPKVMAFGKGVASLFSVLATGDFKGAAASFGLEEDSLPIRGLLALRSAAASVASFVTGTLAPAIKGLFQLFAQGQFTGGLRKALGLEEDSAIIGALFAIRDGAISAFTGLVAFVRGQVIPGVRGIWSAFQGLVTVVAPIVARVVAVFMANWPQISAVVRQVMATVKVVVTSALSIIGSAFRIATTVIKAVWSVFGSTILTTIGRALRAVLTIVKGALNIIQGVFRLFASILKGDWSGAWNAIKQVVRGAWQVISGVVRAGWALIRGLVSAGLAGIKALFHAGWNNLKGVVSAAWSGIKSAVSTGISGAVALVRGLPGKLLGALGDLSGVLRGAGERLIQGLADGMAAKFDAVIGKMRDLAGKIKGFLPGSPIKTGPLKSWNNGGAGKRLVGLLADGLGETGAIDSQMRSLAGRIAVRAPAYAGAAPGSAAPAAGLGAGVHIEQINGFTPASILDELEQRIRRQAALRPTF